VLISTQGERNVIPENLEKANLQEITWDTNQDPIDGDHSVVVQFNPESLKLALSNKNASGDQRGGSAIQYVGAGTSKLSFDLWFDATGSPDGDVRSLTNEVIFFMTPQSTNEEDKFIPPGLRFSWGSFLFEGIMDSLGEDLEYFSEDGRPLRAKLAISMSRQEIRYESGRQQGGSGLGTTASSGSAPQAAAGNSVPDLAGENWAPIAAANGIENPLDLSAGQSLDLTAGLNASAGLSVGAGVSLDATVNAGLSAGASFESSASVGASLGAGLRSAAVGGAGISGDVGFSGSTGISGSAVASAGASLSGAGFAGASGSAADAGASASGFLSGSASTSASASASAQSPFGSGVAGASASASANARFDKKLRR